LSNLNPALNATVLNRNIVHSFTVVNAPANYYTFDLVYGDRHTAGVSTPEDPQFQTTVSGSDIKYQMIIDGWSNAPAHVVLGVKSGFDTSQGCTWVFPSPLFEYDITAVAAPDAGTVPDSKPAVDAGKAIDSSIADGPSAVPVDAPVAIEVSSEAASPADTAAVDATIYDVSLELDAQAVSLDALIGGG
jgi:hypothetical protein